MMQVKTFPLRATLSALVSVISSMEALLGFPAPRLLLVVPLSFLVI
jgi:hypothetical protein